MYTIKSILMTIHVTQRVLENLNYLAFTPIYMKYSWPGGISMVEKPPLHIYDIYLEVEAHGGYGGIWRPFYLSPICKKWILFAIFFHTFRIPRKMLIFFKWKWHAIFLTNHENLWTTNISRSNWSILCLYYAYINH